MNPKTLNLIKMIAVTVGFLSAVVLLQSVNGQSRQEDNHQAITQFTQELIDECAALFDTGDTISDYSKLCGHIMDTLDERCDRNYFSFCFGRAWINYN